MALGETVPTLDGRHVAEPFEEVAARLRAEAIAALLATLPVWDRELFELRYGLGDGREHSCAEIALRLGVSPQAVQQRAGRALARLARRHDAQHLASAVS